MKNAFVASVLLASAAPAVSKLLWTSPDGSCGPDTLFTCKQSFYGGCCGPDNKCGSTADVCGAGCQSKFGYCKPAINATRFDKRWNFGMPKFVLPVKPVTTSSSSHKASASVYPSKSLNGTKEYTHGKPTPAAAHNYASTVTVTSVAATTKAHSSPWWWPFGGNGINSAVSAASSPTPAKDGSQRGSKGDPRGGAQAKPVEYSKFTTLTVTYTKTHTYNYKGSKSFSHETYTTPTVYPVETYTTLSAVTKTDTHTVTTEGSTSLSYQPYVTMSLHTLERPVTTSTATTSLSSSNPWWGPASNTKSSSLSGPSSEYDSASQSGHASGSSSFSHSASASSSSTPVDPIFGSSSVESSSHSVGQTSRDSVNSPVGSSSTSSGIVSSSTTPASVSSSISSGSISSSVRPSFTSSAGISSSASSESSSVGTAISSFADALSISLSVSSSRSSSSTASSLSGPVDPLVTSSAEQSSSSFSSSSSSSVSERSFTPIAHAQSAISQSSSSVESSTASTSSSSSVASTVSSLADPLVTSSAEISSSSSSPVSSESSSSIASTVSSLADPLVTSSAENLSSSSSSVSERSSTSSAHEFSSTSSAISETSSSVESSASVSSASSSEISSLSSSSDSSVPSSTSSADISSSATISSQSATITSSSFSSDSSTFSTTTFSSSTASSSSSSIISSSSTTQSSCLTAPTLTAATLPNCTPCAGQPGNDKFCGYDVTSNSYEVTPITCNVVYYNFDITGSTFGPDGVERPVMWVNGQMPGPALKASWGDTVVVTVNNKLSNNNGTSIHFHGIRQLNNNMNDGVAAITQCPIAPGSSMTYTWIAENYGTSWYHSHFAIQAWEGVMGPMIIDGPHSAEFDVDMGPFQLQDWSHFTADSRYDLAQNATPVPGAAAAANGAPATYGGPVLLDTGLINGMNIWNGDDQSGYVSGSRFVAPQTFTPGQKYLFRFINSAIQSTFKVYLDNHHFTVIATDFVPITPYTTDILNINIGQRYDVIIEATESTGSFFLRADNQNACAGTVQALDIRAIINYDTSLVNDGSTGTAYNYTGECVDEPMASLVPVAPMTVGAADVTEGALNVLVSGNSAQLYKWYISGTSFMAQYNDPTLLAVAQNVSLPTDSGALLIPLTQAKQWIYVIVQSPIPLPHPLHLHGHDFFILAEGSGSYDPSIPLTLVNPPRRDTALMPAAGFIVLAFETDNPGVWLMHCHIGWHTSMGFALQFVEMQDQIQSSGALKNSCALNSTCDAWNSFSTLNSFVQLDSGV